MWFNDLLPGTYTLKETEAPEGYILDNQIYTVIIGINGDISIDPILDKEEKEGEKVFVIENEELEFALALKKIDKESKKLLDGAVFELKKDGVSVAVETTNNGYLQFNDLIAGTYSLQEIEAPDGYKLNNQVYTVVISRNGEITLDSIPIIEVIDDTKVLVIENEIKTNLPNTGGLGSIIFTIFGIALMEISYIGYKKMRKNKK